MGTLGPFVVGTDLGCNYNSVQNAITAAAAVALQTAPVNVYIKPGIYTENLTLAPNVNLIGVGGVVVSDPNYSPSNSHVPVQINGSHSCAFTPNAGLTLDTIEFTNSGGSTPLFTSTGATNCSFIISNCKVSDGNIAQSLFVYANNTICSTEFHDSSFVQTSTGQFYSFSSGGGASATLLFNNCLLLCNDLGPQSAANIVVILNDCTFNAAASGPGNVIINSVGFDGSSYVFTNCTLSGFVNNVTFNASYTFNNCIMTGWKFSGTNNVNATLTMTDCQVTQLLNDLPSELNIPLQTSVTMKNCWFAAQIAGNQPTQYLVNKINPSSLSASTWFSGAYTFKVEAAAYSTGSTPVQLFEIPMDVPGSTVLNIDFMGNTTPTNPSTCSGFIQAGYYLSSGGGGIPVQNFQVVTSPSTGSNTGTVSLSPNTGALFFSVQGTSDPIFWIATIEWSNVFVAN